MPDNEKDIMAEIYMFHEKVATVKHMPLKVAPPRIEVWIEGLGWFTYNLEDK